MSQEASNSKPESRGETWLPEAPGLSHAEMGLFVTLFVGMFIAGHFNKKNDYADYAVKIVLSIIESLIYCVTIFIGIVAILFTTKELFKLQFNLSNVIVSCAAVIFLLLNADYVVL